MLAILSRPQCANSLTHGRCGSNVKSIILKLIIQNSSLVLPTWVNHVPVVNSMLPGETIDQSVLAEIIMACCFMAQSHYLNQYWLLNSEVPWHSQGVHKLQVCMMSLKITAPSHRSLKVNWQIIAICYIENIPFRRLSLWGEWVIKSSSLSPWDFPHW